MRPYPIGNGTVSPRILGEVAALLDALQREGANTDLLFGLDDAEWQRLLEFCDLAHVALRLLEVNTAGFPNWVIDRLQQNARDNAARFETVKAAYIEAAAVLERAGVPHVVLKGFAQAPEYVKDARVRSQSDIDVYCPREHIERAQAALMKIGYEPNGAADSNSDHLPGLTRPGAWTWRGNAYDPQMPPAIELHFCLWNARASLIEIPEVERFWERRIVRRLGNLEFSALHPVDQMGYMALHVLRNVLTGEWVIHHVLELATFLHNHTRDVEFWSQWHEMHSANLRRLEALSFGLARCWFSCALPEVARIEVDRLPPGQRRWLSRFGGAPLEVMFRRNKDGRLLQLLLMRSRSSRQAVLRKAMFPTGVPGPDSPVVRIRYRRALPRPHSNRLAVYGLFLVRKVLVNMAADITFLLHGASLWLSTSALSSQFWLFLGVCFFFDFGVSIYFFFFNLFLTAHGYSEAQLGILTGTMAAGNLVGAWPAAHILQRHGVRNPLLACLVTTPMVLSLRSLSTAFPFQAGLAFSTGMVLCLWAVCISPITAALTTERQRPRAFSLVFSLGIGVGAAGAFLGSRMPEWFSRRFGMTAPLAPDQMTLICACMIAPLALIPARKLRVGGAKAPSRARLLSSPAVRRILPAIGIWGLVTGSFAPFGNVFLATHVQLNLHHVGMVFSTSQLCQVAAVLCAPFVFRRLGVPNGVFAMLIATALCFVVLALTAEPIAAGIAYVSLMGMQYMGEPGIYSLMMSAVPEEERGGASASMALVLGIAQLIAAGGAGWMFTTLGYPRTLAIISFVAVTAGWLFRTLRSQDAHALIPCADNARG